MDIIVAFVLLIIFKVKRHLASERLRLRSPGLCLGLSVLVYVVGFFFTSFGISLVQDVWVMKTIVLFCGHVVIAYIIMAIYKGNAVFDEVLFPEDKYRTAIKIMIVIIVVLFFFKLYQDYSYAEAAAYWASRHY